MATGAAAYTTSPLENPWKDMTSDRTQVASSTGGSGTGAKGGKKGSIQEAPSSAAKTVSFKTPPAEESMGIEVADIAFMMKSLRCTTFSIIQ